MADELRRRRGVHRLQVGRPPDELARMPPRPFKQNRQKPPDASPAERGLLGFEQILQPRQPLDLHRVGHLIGELLGGRAGPRTVLERVGLREPDLGDERERLLDRPPRAEAAKRPVSSTPRWASRRSTNADPMLLRKMRGIQ